MSAKNKRESATFKTAKGKLENTIKRLNECDSYERLQEILKSIAKAKESTQSPYTPARLTPYHQSEIKRMKESIDTLVKQKTVEFPKPVQPVEVLVVQEEQSVSEPVVSVPVTETLEPTDAVQVDSVPDNNINESDDHVQESTFKALNDDRLKELSKVYAQLDRLKTKIDELRVESEEYPADKNGVKTDSYHKAAIAGQEVYNKIYSLCSNYALNKIDLDTFKSEATDFMKSDNQYVKELKTHRGCKDVFANLLLALTGVGLLAIAAVSIYNGRLTMFNLTNTDSGNKVDALKDSVEHVQSASLK
ncbi:hypothetical protein [Legionella quateirensis]|uniref:Uncharacterized protein n=1 Tax=Legionella quateirensis TaxID=45072 RepID=A0A378KV51_9GAMM|nr:hypothetical protein [Legionella quateirensis]KTD53027.1 hypothetical protein Lqua_0860 [Legionella quateirensis]STY17248.1 Uncharacterised protein [Legionella quateirensis]